MLVGLKVANLAAPMGAQSVVLMVATWVASMVDKMVGS